MECPKCGYDMSPEEDLCLLCGHHPSSGRRRSSRPAVVTALALLSFSLSALAFAVAAGLLMMLAPGSVRAAAVAILGGLGLLRLACGLGLWRLRPYGRTLQLLWSGLDCLVFPIGTAISVGVFFYLARGEVKALFASDVPHPLPPEDDGEMARTSRAYRPLTAMVYLLGLLPSGLLTLLLVTFLVILKTHPLLRLETDTGPDFVKSYQPPPSAFVELWRFPLDSVADVTAPPGVAVGVDRKTFSDGKSSLRISADRPGWVTLGRVPESALPPAPNSVIFEAQVLTKDLNARLAIRRSDGEVMVTETGALRRIRFVGETARPRPRIPVWRSREVVFFREESHGLYLVVELFGPGTLWIDGARLLGGPAWEGAEAWKAASATRGRSLSRPSVVSYGLEEIRQTLNGGDTNAKKRLFKRLRAMKAKNVPDKVQKCLIETFLKQRRDLRTEKPLVALLYSAARGPSRRSLEYEHRILPWLMTHSFYQPQYLDDLVKAEPSPILVRTYGREVVAPLLAHADLLLDEPLTKAHLELYGEGASAPFVPDVLKPGRSPFARVNDASFADTVEELLNQEEKGTFVLDPEEKIAFREVLEEHFERLTERELLVFTRYHGLLRVLYRLGSPAVKGRILAIVTKRINTRTRRWTQILELELLASLKVEGADGIFRTFIEAEEDSAIKEYLEGLLRATGGAELPRAPSQRYEVTKDAPPLAVPFD